MIAEGSGNRWICGTHGYFIYSVRIEGLALNDKILAVPASHQGALTEDRFIMVFSGSCVHQSSVRPP